MDNNILHVKNKRENERGGRKLWKRRKIGRKK